MKTIIELISNEVMTAFKEASSTEGANHDIIACGPKMYRIRKYM